VAVRRKLIRPPVRSVFWSRAIGRSSQAGLSMFDGFRVFEDARSAEGKDKYRARGRGRQARCGATC